MPPSPDPSPAVRAPGPRDPAKRLGLRWAFSLFALAIIMGPMAWIQFSQANPTPPSPIPTPWRPALQHEARAILAGGCFWGMQELIRQQPGVLRTRVGYTGGQVAHATYRNHEGHAEAIEVVYDPQRLSYRDLLAFFFQIHDPTTPNRQGNDRGSSYRSAIFFTSPEQEQVAKETIEDVNRSGLWPGPAVTELKPASEFWEAEPEHQDYLQRVPNGYTCHFPRPGWRLPPRSPKP